MPFVSPPSFYCRSVGFICCVGYGAVARTNVHVPVVWWLIVDGGFVTVVYRSTKIDTPFTQVKERKVPVELWSSVITRSLGMYVACIHQIVIWQLSVNLIFPMHVDRAPCSKCLKIPIPPWIMIFMYVLAQARRLHFLPDSVCVCLLMSESGDCWCGTYKCGCHQATTGFQVLHWRRRMQTWVPLLLHGQVTIRDPGVSQIIGQHLPVLGKGMLN